MDNFTWEEIDETPTKTPTSGDYIADQIKPLMGKIRNITDQLPTHEQRRQGAYDVALLLIATLRTFPLDRECLMEVADYEKYINKHYNPNPPKEDATQTSPGA